MAHRRNISEAWLWFTQFFKAESAKLLSGEHNVHCVESRKRVQEGQRGNKLNNVHCVESRKESAREV
jgi:hypothetical protein